MAVLSYNGVYLPFCELNSFRMEAVMDDYAQTDKAVTKFDITVNTLVTADALDMIAPAWAGVTDDPAAIMSAVHEALLTPRRKLSFQFNDYEFIPQPAGVRGFVDAMNGPKPQSLTVLRMDELSWWVSYSIQAHYVVNYSAALDGSGRVVMTNLPGNTVLYNRWEESVSIDKLQYSTRTRTGKFMIRSDNQEGYIADEVRTQMAVVGVPKGFVRESSRYTVTPDGLAISYTVVDQEVFEMPPDGAYEAEGTFTEESSKADGKRHVSCQVHLKGPKFVKRSDLAKRAANLCAATLNARYAVRPLFQPESLTLTNKIAGPAGKPSVLLGASMSFQMFRNEVTCMMQAMVPNNKVWYGSPQLVPFLDRSPGPGGTANPQPKYFDRGSAGILLQAAAYYDPTVRGVRLGEGGAFASDNPQTGVGRKQQMSRGSQPGRGGVEG